MDYLNQSFTKISLKQLDTIAEQEKTFFHKGYKVLYHSMPTITYAENYIVTELLKLHTRLVANKPVPQNAPLLLRYFFKKNSIAPRALKTNEQLPKKSSKLFRKHFLQEGSFNDHLDGKFLLSCNTALTGNIYDPGECSLSYWLNPSKLTPKTDFDALIKKYSQLNSAHYSSDLTACIHRFKKSISTDILLQIVFKNDALLRKTSYLSQPYGHIRTIDGISDPVTHLNRYTQTPDKLSPQDLDETQLRLVLTQDKLLDVLNPKIANNFEIYAYTDPQSALDTFHQAVAAIMAKIEADFIQRSPQSQKTNEL